MTLAPETAAKLIELAEEKHLYLGSAPDTFLGSALQTARKAIDDGLIGEVTSFEACANRDLDLLASIFRFLRMPGGGICYDFGVYYLTAIVSLFGPVDRVVSSVRNLAPKRVNVVPDSPEYGQEFDYSNESQVFTILEMKNGVTGTFCVNGDSTINDQAVFTIYGKKGILKLVDPNNFGGDIVYIPGVKDWTQQAVPEVQGPAKSFNDHWIELGYYTGWYPVCNGNRADYSHLRIGITDGYTVSGSGIISHTEEGMWEMKQPWENFDNVILASPMLKSRRINDNGTTIELIYTDFPDAGADSALQCCHNALKFFRRLYKIAGDEDIYMKFLLSASGTSGGYSRKNFIMLSSRTFNEYVLKNTAHEIGHFWWNKAPVESWHDWLNESFAEFSALQYIRHTRGEKAYAAYIDAYRKETRHIRPIWGIDRNDREAHLALYRKGSVLLADLLVRVGEEPFFNFLAGVIQAHITDTSAFLDFAESRLGRKNRNWIKKRLKE